MLWHLKEYNGISMHKIIKIASPIGLSQYFCKKKKNIVMIWYSKKYHDFTTVHIRKHGIIMVFCCHDMCRYITLPWSCFLKNTMALLWQIP